MKKLTLLSILLLFASDFYAQTVSTYSGAMTGERTISPADTYNAPIEGKGSYKYFEDSEENRIFHGEYKFKYNNGKSIVIEGNYNYGLKDGVWKMSTLGGWSGNVTDYESYTFDKGELNGPYEILENEFFCKILFKGSFSHGQLSGPVTVSFSGNEGTGSITGQFSSGMPDGEWKITRNYKSRVPVIQTRQYDKGLLVSVKVKDLSNGKTEVLFDIPNYSGIEKEEILDNEKFLKIGYKWYTINDNYEDYDTGLSFIVGGQTLKKLFVCLTLNFGIGITDSTAEYSLIKKEIETNKLKQERTDLVKSEIESRMNTIRQKYSSIIYKDNAFREYLNKMLYNMDDISVTLYFAVVDYDWDRKFVESKQYLDSLIDTENKLLKILGSVDIKKINKRLKKDDEYIRKDPFIYFNGYFLEFAKANGVNL